jgi:hypothetical protein
MNAKEFLLTDPKIKEAVSNGYDIRLEEHEWIEKMELYALTKQNSHKHAISGKTNDDKIWQWVQWINKRCDFTEHQQDYIYFAIRQILKSEACATAKGEERKD